MLEIRYEGITWKSNNILLLARRNVNSLIYIEPAIENELWMNFFLWQVEKQIQKIEREHYDFNIETTDKPYKLSICLEGKTPIHTEVDWFYILQDQEPAFIRGVYPITLKSIGFYGSLLTVQNLFRRDIIHREEKAATLLLNSKTTSLSLKNLINLIKRRK